MALAETTWTEYFPEDPSLATADHLPLWLLTGDSFEWYAEPSGVRTITTDKILLPLKFCLDSNLDKLSVFCTASNGTITLKIIQATKKKGNTVSKTVTDEEDIELSINIKDEAFNTGDALLKLTARGNFNVKVNKIVGFYLAGWDEHEASATSWTEGS